LDWVLSEFEELATRYPGPMCLCCCCAISPRGDRKIQFGATSRNLENGDWMSMVFLFVSLPVKLELPRNPLEEGEIDSSRSVSSVSHQLDSHNSKTISGKNDLFYRIHGTADSGD
jgi:hypothetical protein